MEDSPGKQGEAWGWLWSKEEHKLQLRSNATQDPSGSPQRASGKKRWPNSTAHLFNKDSSISFPF